VALAEESCATRGRRPENRRHPPLGCWRLPPAGGPGVCTAPLRARACASTRPMHDRRMGHGLV